MWGRRSELWLKGFVKHLVLPGGCPSLGCVTPAHPLAVRRWVPRLFTSTRAFCAGTVTLNTGECAKNCLCLDAAGSVTLIVPVEIENMAEV